MKKIFLTTVLFTLLMVLMCTSLSHAVENRRLVYIASQTPNYVTEEMEDPITGTLYDIFGEEFQYACSSYSIINTPSQLDEDDPGGHNAHAGMLGQIFIDPDPAYQFSGYGCPDRLMPVYQDAAFEGDIGDGTRAYFEYGLNSACKRSETVESGMQDQKHKQKPGKHDKWVEDPRNPMELGDVPINFTMSENDTTWIIFVGPGALLSTPFGLIPAYPFAYDDTLDCHRPGGDWLLPYQLAAYLRAYQGDGTFVIFLCFAYAERWHGWLDGLDNVLVVYGAGVNETVSIADNIGWNGEYFPENVMWAYGLNWDNFWLPEPLQYMICAVRGFFTSGDYCLHHYNVIPNGYHNISWIENCIAADVRCSGNEINYSCEESEDHFIQINFPEVPDGGPPPEPAPRPVLFPNPFNPTQQIQLAIEKTVHVKLQVFNIEGRQVAILCDYVLQSGLHQFTFSGKNLASGTYIICATVGGQMSYAKALLLK